VEYFSLDARKIVLLVVRKMNFLVIGISTIRDMIYSWIFIITIIVRLPAFLLRKTLSLCCVRIHLRTRLIATPTQQIYHKQKLLHCDFRMIAAIGIPIADNYADITFICGQSDVVTLEWILTKEMYDLKESCK
jgi:hypothetical protein